MFKLRQPENLWRIFEIEKKRELIKHCKSATIYGSDFGTLIFACDARMTLWQHRIHHRHFQPSDLQPTRADLSALTQSGDGPLDKSATKALNKLRQLVEVRRYLVGHIFYTPDLERWHFFYFDQRDVSNRENHWKVGPHIHLINYLWPNRDAQSLWDYFISGNIQLSDSIHIRFIDYADEENGD